jgi:ketosteroid isomerase-like protein
MKYLPLLLALFSIRTFGQSVDTLDIQTQIIALEKAQCEAIVGRDSVRLYQMWAEDFAVNSPTNDVVHLADAKRAFRNGFIDYSFFEAQIENIMIFENMVITMGNETIKPIRNAPMAGETIHRRYTNIWMRRDGEWKIVARHANLTTDFKSLELTNGK